MLCTMEFISLHSIFLVIFFLIFYFVWVAYYRLYLSPIAKFPGPKLAALTFWYELYHDVIRPGQYTWEIARMHEQYGKIYPITSINIVCQFSYCRRILKAQSFGSILMKFTSMTLTSSTKYTLVPPRERQINGIGL